MMLTREQIERAAASLFVTEAGLECQLLGQMVKGRMVQTLGLADVVAILCVHLLPAPPEKILDLREIGSGA